MDSDLELDFEGHVSSYSLAIFYCVKRGLVKLKVFVFIKSTLLRYFLMFISFPSLFNENLEQCMF